MKSITDRVFENVLIAAHDAGGAEVVSSWLKHQRFASVSYLLAGPAVKVFKSKVDGMRLSDAENCHELQRFQLVLTGTSWGSELEKDVICRARQQHVFVASFLDHWTNYKERFLYKGKLCLPDELWVGDEYALEMAQAVFPQHKIVKKQNYYLEDIAAEVRKLSVKASDTGQPRILYVCEPRHMKYGDPGFWGYTEFEALEGFLGYLVAEKINAQLRLRLHPSEKPGKYDAVIEKYKKRLDIHSSHATLVEDSAWADWIAGCDSMAMVVGVLGGKKVFSVIPRGGRKMTLPFREIIRLFNP